MRSSHWSEETGHERVCDRVLGEGGTVPVELPLRAPSEVPAFGISSHALQILNFEPSLDASSLRSDVMSSIMMLSPMGRLGQDKPAFGWELEPLWPLLLYRVVTLRMITQRSELHHAQV